MARELAHEQLVGELLHRLEELRALRALCRLRALQHCRQQGVPYFEGHKKQMPVVLLKNKETGQKMWVMNVHNPASTKNHPGNEHNRDVATQKEIGFIKHLEKTAGRRRVRRIGVWVERMPTTPDGNAVISSGAIKLFLQETGTGEPILFLSGLGYASWCWEEVMGLLSSNFRAIAVDNRGAGRSDKPEGPLSIADLADDAAATLTALGLSSAHVIGNSMGGYIALTLAVRHPRLVSSLVLSNTSHGGKGATAMPDATARAWHDASKASPAEFARKTMPYSYPPGWAEANAVHFESILARRLEYPTPPACWLAHFNACVQFGTQGLDVSVIEQPALVIHGTEDRVVPYANGPRLAQALKHGELHTMEGVGHLPLLECPAQFADATRSFLEAQR